MIRHPEDDYYKELVESPTITASIVNGGDGSGQHPSQCLLDLLTIYEEFGRFEGLKIAIAGDLTHSRVAKSNMQILKRLGAELYFYGPEEWYSEAFNAYGTYIAIDQIIKELDVLMLLRVQHERHDGHQSFSKEGYHQAFGLTQERYQQLKILLLLCIQLQLIGMWKLQIVWWKLLKRELYLRWLMVSLFAWLLLKPF